MLVHTVPTVSDTSDIFCLVGLTSAGIGQYWLSQNAGYCPDLSVGWLITITVDFSQPAWRSIPYCSQTLTYCNHDDEGLLTLSQTLSLPWTEWCFSNPNTAVFMPKPDPTSNQRGVRSIHLNAVEVNTILFSSATSEQYCEQFSEILYIVYKG